MPKVSHKDKGDKEKKKSKKEDGGKASTKGKVAAPRPAPAGNLVPETPGGGALELAHVEEGMLTDVLLREVIKEFNLNKYVMIKTVGEAILVLSLLTLYAKELRAMASQLDIYPFHQFLVPVLSIGGVLQIIILMFFIWLASLDVNQNLIAFYEERLPRYQTGEIEPISTVVPLPLCCTCVVTDPASPVVVNPRIMGAERWRDVLCWKCVKPTVSLRTLNYFCLILVYIVVALNAFVIAFASTPE